MIRTPVTEVTSSQQDVHQAIQATTVHQLTVPPLVTNKSQDVGSTTESTGQTSGKRSHPVDESSNSETRKRQRQDSNQSGTGKKNWRKRNRRRNWRNRYRHNQQQKQSREWDGDREVDKSLNLKEEQEKRADFVRMSMRKYGKPYAPFNTTQFLMEDHNVREPEFEEISKLLRLKQDQENDSLSTTREEGDTDSDDFYSSPDDFQSKQLSEFSEVYEHVHTERLNSMSKKDLVHEYILLDQKAEELEKKLKVSERLVSELRSQLLSSSSSSSGHQVVVVGTEKLQSSNRPSEVGRENSLLSG